MWDNYVNVKMIFFLFILSVFFKKLEFFFWFYLIGEVLFIIKKIFRENNFVWENNKNFLVGW